MLDKRRNRPDLATLSDAELVAYARTFLPELDNAFAIHDYSTLGSAVGPAMLGDLCAAAGRPDALLDLISGLGEVRSASPSWGLWDLSRTVTADPALSQAFDAGAPVLDDFPAFAEQFAQFLHDHGQRGPNEWDIRAVSWEAGPEQVLALVDSMRHMPDDNSPDARHERLEQQRWVTADEVRSALPDDEKRQSFDVALASTARMIPLREQTKLVNVTSVNEVRMAMRELGRRGVDAGLFAAPEDVMMLLESELDDYVDDPTPFAPVIADRLETYLHAVRPRAAVHRRLRPGSAVPVAATLRGRETGGDPG